MPRLTIICMFELDYVPFIIIHYITDNNKDEKEKKKKQKQIQVGISEHEFEQSVLHVI